MLQVTTKYDKVLVDDVEVRKKIFVLRGDEAYARTTNITLEQNGNIVTGDVRGFKINLKGNIYRNIGESTVTIYDGEQILDLLVVGDGEHSFSLNNIYLPYLVNHELYAVFDDTKYCMGSKSKKLEISVPLPSTLKTSITFDNVATQINANSNLNVRMIATMNNDIVDDDTPIKVYDNNVLVGTATTTNGVATLTITNMSQGKHTITASIEQSSTVNAVSNSMELSCGYDMEFITIPNVFINGANNTVSVSVSDYFGDAVANKSVSSGGKTSTTNSQGIATFNITNVTDGNDYTATCSGSTVSKTVNAVTLSALNLSVEDGITTTNQDEKVTIRVTGNGYTGNIPCRITTSNGISTNANIRLNTDYDWYYKGEGSGDATVTVSCGQLSKSVTIEDVLMAYKSNSYQYNLNYDYTGTLQKNPTHILWKGSGDDYLRFDTGKWTPVHSIEFDIVEITDPQYIIFGMENQGYANIPNATNGDSIKIVREEDEIKFYRNDTLVTTAMFNSQDISRWEFRIITIMDLKQSINPQIKFNNLKIK